MIHMDLDEGQVRLACLSCKGEGDSERAKVTIAHPFRFYVAALACCECGEELTEFHIYRDVA